MSCHLNIKSKDVVISFFTSVFVLLASKLSTVSASYLLHRCKSRIDFHI